MEGKNPRHRYLHALCQYPEVTFEAQEKDEHVILVLRAHPVTQLSWIIAAVFAFIIMLLLNILYPAFLNVNQIIFINFFFVIAILSYIWINILLYTFNVGIVSSKRILDMDFHNILYRETSESRLSNVEDITARQAGYFGALFHYGNVFVQTAGTEINIEFLNVPEPADVVRIINSLFKH